MTVIRPIHQSTKLQSDNKDGKGTCESSEQKVIYNMGREKQLHKTLAQK